MRLLCAHLLKMVAPREKIPRQSTTCVVAYYAAVDAETTRILAHVTPQSVPLLRQARPGSLQPRAVHAPCNALWLV